MTCKYTVLDECPEWPLVHYFSKGGGWTNAIVELFAETETGPATHMHFYTTREKARDIWRELNDLNKLPDTLTSVSFRDS
jgi:hypothetical protein